MFQLIGKNGFTPSKFDRVLKMKLKSSLVRWSTKMILNDKAFINFIEFAPRGDNDNMN